MEQVPLRSSNSPAAADYLFFLVPLRTQSKIWIPPQFPFRILSNTCLSPISCFLNGTPGRNEPPPLPEEPAETTKAAQGYFPYTAGSYAHTSFFPLDYFQGIRYNEF